jgi:gas vesicle protein
MRLRFILGLLIGMMLGASVGLALVPHPGIVTRQRLWERGKTRVLQQRARA